MRPVRQQCQMGAEIFGAGDGNRTRTASLEGWDSTIELHPRRAGTYPLARQYAITQTSTPTGAACGGFRHRPNRRQILLEDRQVDGVGGFPVIHILMDGPNRLEIGRASCRER